MTIKRFQNDRATQDGKAYNDGTGQYKWYNSDGDQAITVGEFIVWRFTLTVPKGSTINKATWRTEYIVKNGDSFPQSFSYNAFMEFNAPEYPMVNDTYLGPIGTFPPGGQGRVRTNASVNGTLTYTSNTPEADFFEANMTTCVQEIVNRSDYIPGQPVAMILAPNAESGDISLRMRNHDWAAEHPSMIVDYTEPFASETRYDVNWNDNSVFELDLEDWFINAAYGYYVTTSTLERSTEQKRDGSYSMKIISGAADGDKNFGVMGHFTASQNTSYRFSGWVYIPTAGGVSSVIPQFQYVTGGPTISVKDKWVPFTTNIYITGAGPTALWPGVSAGIAGTGKYFYLDGLSLTETTHEQMPFTGYSANTNVKTHITHNPNKKDATTRIRRLRTQAYSVPLKVLDDMDTTTGWTNTTHGGASITFSLSGGGVVSTVGTNFAAPAPTARFTKDMLINKRYLAVNAVWNNMIVSKIAYSDTDFIVNPTPVATSGSRKYYDLGIGQRTIKFVEFSAPSGTSTSSFTVYDLCESEYPSNVAGFHPSQKWVRNSDNLWVAADSERQSPTLDDFAAAGMTLAQVTAMGKTYDQLEADTTVSGGI